jgi:hypothetical protein
VLIYTDLYLNNEHSNILRENLYKEKTSVLSYYVIKTVLMNNFQGFLSWCKNKNFSLLQFKKTLSNQISFCKFIEASYRSKSMLENIADTQMFLKKVLKKNTDISNYMLSNLRMTICELG